MHDPCQPKRRGPNVATRTATADLTENCDGYRLTQTRQAKSRVGLDHANKLAADAALLAASSGVHRCSGLVLRTTTGEIIRTTMGEPLQIIADIACEFFNPCRSYDFLRTTSGAILNTTLGAPILAVLPADA